MAQDTAMIITGAGGFVGQVLIGPLLASDPTIHLTIADLAQPLIPSSIPASEHHRITSLAADLTDPSVMKSLFSRRFATVYLLHGLMSGGSEADLELGLKVNLDSVRGVLDHLRREYQGTKVVFTSSCAVYGPREPVVESETPPMPQTSYGTQKLINELLLNDFSRKGLLDGRIVRLPTVAVRAGAPSSAASSFASGIIREPLQGLKSSLPVARDLPVWICSPETIVTNLVRIKDVPAERFGASRVVNLPGITVTVQKMLDVLEQVGGKEALVLVEEKDEPAVSAIVLSWPARFDVSRAYSLGLKPDVSFLEGVKIFAQSLKK